MNKNRTNTPKSTHPQTLSSQPSSPTPEAPPTPNRSPHPGSEKYPAADPSHWTNERLLLLYIDHSMTIADIAFTINRSIVDTIALLESPEFIALTEKYLAAQQKRLNFRAQCDREIAASTFARLAEHCDKPETARKAAGSIIRMIEAPKHTPTANSPDQLATRDRTHTETKRQSPRHKHSAAENGLPEITITSQQQLDAILENFHKLARANDLTITHRSAAPRAAA